MLKQTNIYIFLGISTDLHLNCFLISISHCNEYILGVLMNIFNNVII